MSTQKKKNFTSFEKKYLLECMVNYKNIIENKKTDGTSVKAKQEAWLKIAAAFNSSTHINEKATDKQLQRLWANLKQRQRSELAKERQHRIATGGGESIGDVEIDPLIETINPHLIVEIPAANDSDSFQTDEPIESVILSEQNDTIISIEESEDGEMELSKESDQIDAILAKILSRRSLIKTSKKENVDLTSAKDIDIEPAIKKTKIDLTPAKTSSRHSLISNDNKIIYEEKKSNILEKEAEQRLESKIDLTPSKTSSRRSLISRNNKMLYEEKKSSILEKEAEQRLELLQLEKKLKEQIRTEKEKQREVKARADIAELELHNLKNK